MQREFRWLTHRIGSASDKQTLTAIYQAETAPHVLASLVVREFRHSAPHVRAVADALLRRSGWKRQFPGARPCWPSVNHARTYADTALATYDREAHWRVYRAAGVERFVYEGPSDLRTRPFSCGAPFPGWPGGRP